MTEMRFPLNRVVEDTFVFDSVEYKGKTYPTLVINVDKVDSSAKECNMHYLVTLADYELWAAMEDDYDNDVSEAVELDNEIFYYCDSGFIASNPTEEEVIEYMKHTIG